MATLSISLLGTFAVTYQGQPVVAFPYDKVRALLAYLAVEADRPQRRARLAALFWPDEARRVALQSLSQALYQLRRALPAGAAPPWLIITSQTIQFNQASDAWLDVQAFVVLLATNQTHAHDQVTTCSACLARLQQAVTLYRGNFLDGFSLRDTPEFDEWALVQRERLQRLATEALRNLVMAAAQRADEEETLRYSQQWLALDPWQEEAHRQVMTALAARGQYTAALAQFEHCRRLLATELSVEPAAETLALYAHIRAMQEAGQAHAQIVPASRHNLPAPVTPLIGYRQEVAQLQRCLQDPMCRLMSIVGPGGSGKTRLAVEVAGQYLMRFTNGVVFVALAAVDTPAALVPAIAQALGLPFAKDEDPQRQLLGYLRPRALLLLLDNFEHLLVGAPLLTAILADAPQVKILVTARAQLNLQGEQIITMTGLTLPGAAATSAEGTDETDAIALFLYHARRLQPTFQPNAAERAAIAQICVAVDGMPLAILLAAAWLELLSPTAIAHKLVDELANGVAHGVDFLAADWPDLPARQRSMRAVLDQSWRLLPIQEQRVLAALALFRGGFTYEAANDVAGATLHQLRALVEKALLHRAAEHRYEIHELLRQYAAERLQQSPATAAQVSRRHSAYYAAALQEWASALRGSAQLAALAALTADLGNVRQAWVSAVERADVDAIAQALDGLCLFFEWRGRYQQGEDLCRLASEHLRHRVAGAQGGVVARLLAWHGFFSQLLGHWGEANRCLQESLTLLTELAAVDQDQRGDRAFTLYVLGQVRHDASRGEAQQYWEESLTLYRALADVWGMVQVLTSLGQLAIQVSDYTSALRLLEESLEYGRTLGDHKSMARTLCVLGNAYATRGHLTMAERLNRESVALSEAVGDRLGAADSQVQLAGDLAYQGQFRTASALYVQAAAIYQELGAQRAYALASHLLGWMKTNLGEYATVYEHFQIAQAIYRAENNQHGIALSMLGLGGVALVEHAYTEAQRLLNESAVLFAAVHQWDEQAIALGMLAAALHGLQCPVEAKQCIQQALQITTAIGAFAPALFALESYALLLAERDQPACALTIYTMVATHPYVKHSCWHEDCFGRQIAAQAAALSSSEAADALARGQTADLQATVTALLAELNA